MKLPDQLETATQNSFNESKIVNVTSVANLKESTVPSNEMISDSQRISNILFDISVFMLVRSVLVIWEGLDL